MSNCQYPKYKLCLYMGDRMISYEPFYLTLKKKNITTYQLIKTYKINRGLLDRLKHNRPINTTTLDTLCRILQCRVEDILVYKEK